MIEIIIDLFGIKLICHLTAIHMWAQLRCAQIGLHQNHCPAYPLPFSTHWLEIIHDYYAKPLSFEVILSFSSEHQELAIDNNEWYGLPLWLSWGRICLQCRTPGFNPWGGKIPWRRERLPTPVFWPGEFHGLYSLWSGKDLDTTKWLSLSIMV